MITDDVRKVKNLCEEIGYGYVMSLASGLWRKLLKNSGGPVSGAFIPICLTENEIEKDKIIKQDVERYDKITEIYDIPDEPKLYTRTDMTNFAKYIVVNLSENVKGITIEDLKEIQKKLDKFLET